MGLVTVGIDANRVYFKNSVTQQAIGLSSDLARDFARFLRKDFTGNKETFGPISIRREEDAVLFETETGGIFVIVPTDAVPLISKALAIQAVELDRQMGKIDLTLDEAIFARLGIHNLITRLGVNNG